MKLKTTYIHSLQWRTITIVTHLQVRVRYENNLCSKEILIVLSIFKGKVTPYSKGGGINIPN